MFFKREKLWKLLISFRYLIFLRSLLFCVGILRLLFKSFIMYWRTYILQIIYNKLIKPCDGNRRIVKRKIELIYTKYEV